MSKVSKMLTQATRNATGVAALKGGLKGVHESAMGSLGLGSGGSSTSTATGSTTGPLTINGVTITEDPADYPAHWYTNWKNGLATHKMDFQTWVASVLQQSPNLADEVLALRNGPDDGTEEVGLEQDLLDRTLENYVYPALEEDKANQARFKELLASYQPAIDANRQLVTDLATEDGTTGHSVLASQELANLEEALATSKGAIDTRQQSKNANLDEALAEYLSAIDAREGDKLGDLDPLLQARLDSAEGLATSASLGEQAARDQIVADLASQGYFGGSSYSDGQLARASIAARQTAANALGSAREANATDVLKVKNEATDSTYDTNTGITTKRLGVNDEAADSLFDTTSFGADQRLAYLDADTKRRLSNLETPLTLAQDEIDLKTSVDDAGWAGLKRGLSALNWWKLSQADGGGNVTTAPNTVDTTTSAAGVIGPSLVNAGLSIAQSKNWWQKRGAQARAEEDPK